MNTKNFKMDLQLFNDSPSEGINSVSDLDSLLGGNTSAEETKTDPPTDPSTETPKEEPDPLTEGTGEDGGDPNLESSEGEEDPAKTGKEETPAVEDEGVAAQNAAFARMRIENAKKDKVLTELAKALGIDEKDPMKLGDLMVDMAQKKLAKDANIPIELYKELNSTKEQLAAVQYDQHQRQAKERFQAVQDLYELTQDELITFARQLDNEGVNAVSNPQIDLEYEYYKRNRAAIDKKRIAAAVEEALRNSNTAEEKGTTPTKQHSGPTDPKEDKKIDNVSALNQLLSDRK